MRGWTRKIRARKFFGIDGDPNLVLHHIDVEMRHKDPDRYVQWRPEDLTVMTREEHSRLHNTGKTLSEEHKRKIGESLKGNKYSLGRVQSYETRRKIAAAQEKKVICIETGQVFKSAQEASISLGASKRQVSKNIGRGCKTRGYTFEYINKEIK